MAFLLLAKRIAPTPRIHQLIPRFFYSSITQCPDPDLLAFQDMGLSDSTLTQLILSNPRALHSRSVAPKIKFWTHFFGGDQTALSKAFKKNRGLANYDIDRIISPNLSLLQNHGFSTEYIRKIVLQVPSLIVTRVSMVEDWMLHAKDLGFQPGTGMFLVALHAVRCVTREDLQRKRELLLSFGWSEDEFLNAVRRVPTFFGLMDKNLQAKMDFLIEEAGFDLLFVKSHPQLFLFSLEKNLRPRFHILQKLESSGLSVVGRRFLSAIYLKKTDFVEKYIHPHREVISGLDDAFLAACT